MEISGRQRLREPLRRVTREYNGKFLMTDTNSLPQVTITSDGAARGNPGPGGWAALLQRDGKEKLISGEHPNDTTNNAMELLAAISALEALNRPCRVLLRADS